MTGFAILISTLVAWLTAGDFYEAYKARTAAYEARTEVLKNKQ